MLYMSFVLTNHFSRDSDEELSAAEEEFYYTEVEDDMDSVTHSFAHMYTSTPPSLPSEKLEMAQTFDHDYQRKVTVWSCIFAVI